MDTTRASVDAMCGIIARAYRLGYEIGASRGVSLILRRLGVCAGLRGQIVAILAAYDAGVFQRAAERRRAA